MNYDFSLVHRLCFYVSVSFLYITSILSTQPTPKVILSTQLCHLICSQSLDFAAFDRIENAVKSHLNATNPLKSEPFHTPDFRPLTSTRHTQHVIVRLLANISISSEKPYFVGFRHLFYLINFQLLIRLFFIISLILLLPLLNYSLVLQLFLLLFSLYYQLSSFAQFVIYLIRNHD